MRAVFVRQSYSACGDSELILDPLMRALADRGLEGLGRAIELAFELASRPSTAPAARVVAEEYGMEKMVQRRISLCSGPAAEARFVR